MRVEVSSVIPKVSWMFLGNDTCLRVSVFALIGADMRTPKKIFNDFFDFEHSVYVPLWFRSGANRYILRIVYVWKFPYTYWTGLTSDGHLCLSATRSLVRIRLWQGVNYGSITMSQQNMTSEFSKPNEEDICVQRRRSMQSILVPYDWSPPVNWHCPNMKSIPSYWHFHPRLLRYTSHVFTNKLTKWSYFMSHSIISPRIGFPSD